MLHSKQIEASNPEISAWVSASAGTGKTKVLTSRVLKLLLNGSQPGKILCLTFTKAAAGEMINRINSYINSWPKLNNFQLEEELQELLDRRPTNEELNRAKNLFSLKFNSDEFVKIYTIHSFCQYILKRFPIEAGISPNFKVIDEYMSHSITEEIRYNLLENSGRLDNKQLKKSLEFIASNFHDNSIMEIINNIILERGNFSLLFSRYPHWSQYEEFLRQSFDLGENEYERDVIEKLQRKIKSLDLPGYLEKASSRDNNLLGQIENFKRQTSEISAQNFGEFKNLFLTQKHTARKNIISANLRRSEPELEENLQLVSKAVIDCLEKIKSLRIIFYTKHLYSLARHITQKYSDFKTDGGYLDYQDLIDYTNRLLNNRETADWVLYKLDGGLHHLLIDEAQDTSFRQWEIIGALVEDFYAGESFSGDNRTIFVVGDEKQSIFSFQGARPEIFSELADYFGNKFNLAGKDLREIDLDISYRSTNAILDIVDNTFSHLQQRFPECLNYDSKKIACHRRDHPGRVEIWPLFYNISEEEQGFEEWLEAERASPRNYEMLAGEIAKRVKSMLGGKYLPSRQRYACEEDIIILFRRRSNFTHTLISTLKNYGLAVAGLDRMVLTDNLAIKDVIAACKFALLPNDELNLACLLKSPLINLSEQDLYHLSARRAEDSLWEYLPKLISHRQDESNLSADRKRNYQRAYNYLNFLLELNNNCNSISQFFLWLLETHGGRQKLCNALGNEVNDPIDEFINTVIDYQSNNPNSSMQEFIHWLENSQIQIKRDAEAGEGLKVMTVHGAKGLQAPIVFLADTTSLPGSATRFFWDNDSNLYWPGSSQNHNSICEKLKQQNLGREFSEYLRLLYVAMTRAEDELYITGISDKKNPPEECWYNLIYNGAAEIGENKEFVNDKSDESEEGRENPEQPAVEDYIKTNSCIIYSQNGTKEFDKSQDRLEYDASTISHYAQVDNSPQIDITPKLPEDQDYPLENIDTTSSNNSLKNQGSFVSIFDSRLATTYGSVLHKIMEDYVKTMDRNLALSHPDLALLSEDEKQAGIQAISSILDSPEFRQLLADSDKLKPEVPLGQKSSDGSSVIGRVDLLAINNKDRIIQIIDYKSDAITPEDNDPAKLPEKYITQLRFYRNSAARIYKGYKIKTKLLWLKTGKFMEVVV
jgi:ATP-dependent helicase/nuclease subunit A